MALQKMPQRKILVAEDHADTVELLQIQLKRIGYPDVLVATNGLDALDKAREEKPDLILMDIRLPGMNGLEVTRRLKADPQTRPILILALTAKAMPSDRKMCLESGCDGYLAKPVLPHQLKAEIEKLLTQAD
ncbi:MAG: response regulator [Candidatus Binatia bacterium]